MQLFTGIDLVGLLAGATFASGLNVYAAVATLGLLGRAEVVTLPPHLHLLQSGYVITAALVMFVIEFFADKVPLFDLVWNALHTFIRVPIAALLAYGASAHLSPPMQILAAALGGGVALAAHGSKLAARSAVTPSPEPVSNMALSVGEDAAAIGLTWMATKHPVISAVVVLILLVLSVVLIRAIIRAFKRFFHGAEQAFVPRTA